MVSGHLSETVRCHLAEQLQLALLLAPGVLAKLVAALQGKDEDQSCGEHRQPCGQLLSRLLEDARFHHRELASAVGLVHAQSNPIHRFNDVGGSASSVELHAQVLEVRADVFFIGRFFQMPAGIDQA